MKVYEFSQKLPKLKKTDQSLLIFDSILLKNKNIKQWISKFPNQYGVKSGETLKDIYRLPLHLEKILGRQITFNDVYVLGGGSVGDFGGFIASILRRGLPVYQIPSTWLAALDSAHGGKTALNVAGYKNQVGTYHFPKKVWIVKEVLESQPAERLYEAAGEFLKTAMIGGEPLLKKLSRWDWANGKIGWSDLKSFVEVKYKVIKKDPFEKKGIRYILNLGHTMGHVWEACFGIPHGLAVFHGLMFDMAWSVQKGFFDARRSIRMMDENPWNFIWDEQFKRKVDKKLFSLNEREVQDYLMKDKKLNADGLNCLFIKKPGAVFVQKMKIEDILREYRRQQRVLQEFYENL